MPEFKLPTYLAMLKNVRSMNLNLPPLPKSMIAVNEVLEDKTRPRKVAPLLAAVRGVQHHDWTIYKPPLYYAINTYPAVRPPSLRWLVPEIAGMRRPDDNDETLSQHFLWLFQNGYRTAISFEKEGAETTRKYTQGSFPDVLWLGCYIVDWCAPSVDMMEAFCKFVDQRKNKGKVMVHCIGGVGRTGCFLAAWLLYSRKEKTAERALAAVRKYYNPHAIEMKVQYNALARFADHLHGTKSMTVDDKSFPHENGRWDLEHGDDGLKLDPGHTGSGGGGSKWNAHLVHKYKCLEGHLPYISPNINASPQGL